MAGYVWRSAPFDWATMPLEDRAEWARYLTKNQHANEAYNELRQAEVRVIYATEKTEKKTKHGVRMATGEMSEVRRAARAYHKARTQANPTAA